MGAALLVVALAGLILTAGAPVAGAHALVSSLSLTVAGEGPAVSVTAQVRYPDHGPVVGEMVVGVAWSPATQQVVPLSFVPLDDRPGCWRLDTHLAPGPWKVEVDAVRRTRGLQSVGLVVGVSGPPTAVVSPSPLPANVAVPRAPAEVDAAGLRQAPSTGPSTTTVVLVVVLGLVVSGVPVVLLRRRSPPGGVGTDDERKAPA